MATATQTAAVSGVNDRREIFGWMMYDWANSAFSTTTITVFLGPYLANVAKASADVNGNVFLLGIPMHYNSFFTYIVSTSVVLQVFLLPLLGAIADYSHLRKTMMQVFCVIGAAAAMAMFLILPGMYVLGAALLILSNVAFGASIVFYNAYLPDIASIDQQDTVSARGWAIGYAGGGLLLVLNLVLYLMGGRIGVDAALAARISLFSAGAWWLGFAYLFTFPALRPRHARRQLPAGDSYLSIGFKQIAATFREMSRFPMTIRYLVAYLLYNDGIQTVIVVSSLFGAQELGMTSSQLIPLILMVQWVAFVSAYVFGLLTTRFGAKRTLVGSLVIWSVIVTMAWFVRDQTSFWIMGVAVALVMGGSQAISRSMFAKMIPLGREAEFFGFYEVSDKGTSWIGTLLFGLANQIFGGLRYGIISLIVLFVGGLLVLLTVNVPRAIREAGREPEGVL